MAVVNIPMRKDTIKEIKILSAEMDKTEKEVIEWLVEKYFEELLNSNYETKQKTYKIEDDVFGKIKELSDKLGLNYREIMALLVEHNKKS